MPHFISTVVIAGMVLPVYGYGRLPDTADDVIWLSQTKSDDEPFLFQPIYVISRYMAGDRLGSIIYIAADSGINSEFMKRRNGWSGTVGKQGDM